MNQENLSPCEENNYRTLYNKHFTGVRNFIYYRTGDLDMAEDMAQESFIRLWENCASVLYEKAKAFLMVTASRLFLNNYRHEKIKLKFIKSTAAGDGTNQQRPDFAMEEKEFKTKLEAAISALPDIQREVFLMNRIDKMTYTEIADVLGISVKAVEKRMGSCLKTLRDSLDELKIHKI